MINTMSFAGKEDIRNPLRYLLMNAGICNSLTACLAQLIEEKSDKSWTLSKKASYAKLYDE